MGDARAIHHEVLINKMPNFVDGRIPGAREPLDVWLREIKVPQSALLRGGLQINEPANIVGRRHIPLLGRVKDEEGRKILNALGGELGQAEVEEVCHILKVLVQRQKCPLLGMSTRPSAHPSFKVCGTIIVGGN